MLHRQKNTQDSEGTIAQEDNEQGKMADPQGRILAELMEKTVTLFQNTTGWLKNRHLETRLRKVNKAQGTI